MTIDQVRFVGISLLLLSIAACSAATPFEYTPASEMSPAPGLFSGADGELVIYRSSVDDTDEKQLTDK